MAESRTFQTKRPSGRKWLHRCALYRLCRIPRWQIFCRWQSNHRRCGKVPWYAGNGDRTGKGKKYERKYRTKLRHAETRRLSKSIKTDETGRKICQTCHLSGWYTGSVLWTGSRRTRTGRSDCQKYLWDVRIKGSGRIYHYRWRRKRRSTCDGNCGWSMDAGEFYLFDSFAGRICKHSMERQF